MSVPIMTEAQFDEYVAKLHAGARTGTNAVPKAAQAAKSHQIAQNQAGRASRHGMNKTEARYAQDLELQKRAGVVIWWKFEGFTLTLAPGARFTPDFAVMKRSGELEFHEIKGFWREAARVRIKVAASLYPFKFIAVQAIKQKDGGGWKVEKF